MNAIRKCVRILRVIFVMVSVAFLMFWGLGQFWDIWLEIGSRFAVLQCGNSVIVGIGNTLGFREYSDVPIVVPFRLNAESKTELFIHDMHPQGFHFGRFHDPSRRYESSAGGWTSYPPLGVPAPPSPPLEASKGYVVGFPNWFGCLVFAIWPMISFCQSWRKPNADAGSNALWWRIPFASFVFLVSFGGSSFLIGRYYEKVFPPPNEAFMQWQGTTFFDVPSTDHLNWLTNRGYAELIGGALAGAVAAAIALIGFNLILARLKQAGPNNVSGMSGKQA